MTFENLIEECRPLHNTICVVADHELARLVGVHADDDDFVYRLRGIGVRGEWLMSAVARVVSLRGIYPEKEYGIMDDVFSLNGAGPAEEFIVTDLRGR